MSEGLGLSTLRELVVKLGFDVDEKKLEGFERGLETAKAAAEALSIVWDALVVGLFELTRETAEYGEEVQINSELLGISTDKFQKLRYSAQAFGIENENIINSLRYFNKTMGDMASGIGEGAQGLRMLGVRFHEIKGMPVDKQLAVIADRLHGISSASQRAAASAFLFGRSGAHFGQFLAQGSGKVAELGEQLNGLMMTPEQVEAGQKTRAALIQVKALITALRNEIGVRLFPAVQMIAKSFMDWVQANKKLLEQRIDRFVHLVTEAVRIGWETFLKLYQVVLVIIRALGGLENTLKLLGITMGAIFAERVIGSILEGAKALRELGAAGLLANAEILLIPAAIVGLLLALDDLRAWFMGEDSVFGTLIGPFAKIKKGFEGIVAPIKKMFEGFRELGSGLGSGIMDTLRLLRDVFSDLSEPDKQERFFKDVSALSQDILHSWMGIRDIIKGLGGTLLELAKFDQQGFAKKHPSSPGSPGPAYQPSYVPGADLIPQQGNGALGIKWPGVSWDLPPWLNALSSLRPREIYPGSSKIDMTINMPLPAGTPQAHIDYVKQGAQAIFDTMFNQHLFQALQAAPAGD